MGLWVEEPQREVDVALWRGLTLRAGASPEPSMVTLCFVCKRCVASATPTTAGMPYSRATTEPWEVREIDVELG